MRPTIEAMAYHLPENVVTNDDLLKENPGWDMAQVETRSGVVSRRVANSGQTALDLAEEACKKLFKENPGLESKIDGVIFCTQTPDYILPPNSTILHGRLKLSESTFATDINLACSGFVYGLALARGLILGKTARNILLVTADTYSKHIGPKDRSTRAVFGDGAAVSWISDGQESERPGLRGTITDIMCATSGEHFQKFLVPAGGCRAPKSAETSKPIEESNGNIRSLEQIQMDGMGIFSFVNSRVPKQVKATLERNQLTTSDVDVYVFHQASKLAIDSLARLLALPEQKVFTNIREIGNTVAASIPIAMTDAIRAGKIQKGQRVLVCGFGVGLSWATALVEF